jgi:hypothetical protein
VSGAREPQRPAAAAPSRARCAWTGCTGRKGALRAPYSPPCYLFVDGFDDGRLRQHTFPHQANNASQHSRGADAPPDLIGSRLPQGGKHGAVGRRERDGADPEWIRIRRQATFPWRLRGLFFSGRFFNSHNYELITHNFRKRKMRAENSRPSLSTAPGEVETFSVQSFRESFREPFVG